MPSALTYPGVDSEEIPSGVRTITGVATSITAFIGRAARGPVNEPTTISSFGDFQREFGGLATGYPMSYAVRDFYLNGGSTALIVRLVDATTAAATLSLPTGAAAPNDFLPLLAADVGKWGNNLSGAVNYQTNDVANTDLFNLTIVESDPITGQPVNTEKFLNVSINAADARYVARVLQDSSSLVVVKKD